MVAAVVAVPADAAAAPVIRYFHLQIIHGVLLRNECRTGAARVAPHTRHILGIVQPIRDAACVLLIPRRLRAGRCSVYFGFNLPNYACPLIPI